MRRRFVFLPVHVCRIDKDAASQLVDLTPNAKAYFAVTGWWS